MPKFTPICPSQLPKTTDRILLLSAQELSRLVRALSQTINGHFEQAIDAKETIQSLKNLGGKDGTRYTRAFFYKERNRALTKAKKLSELQYKLKHCADTNSQFFNTIEKAGLTLGVIQD